MNPSGLRIEEKKSTDTSVHLDSKSQSSYKSTHSSRSSVLERAREYNRRIDAQQRGRAKSLERPKNGSEAGASEASSRSRRSVSAGRYPNGSNRHSTRERAMASVRKDSSSSRYQKEQQQHRGTPIQQQMSYTSTAQTQPSTPASHNHVTSGSNPHSVSRPSSTTPRSTASRQIRPSSRSAASPGNRSMKSSAVRHKVGDQPQQDAIVTPELLVDALSGHEDGLLAIAERLMEHYDSGYDVMGEAIIDAFADVQKLFQHVVEAAHMEGAAFEASRREEEITELRRQAAAAGDMAMPAMEDTNTTSPSGPNRHDEFIDQDVKDVLTEAIRKGSILRDQNKHTECFELYERACQAASSLLPVDSDHRGRLQLSIARADSMSADRACAILRYAMDDVLRSGMRAVRTPLPDPSKRADVVLSRPKAHPAMTGGSVQSGVVQSADEALASLIEEMKEILSAPVYSNTPLQAVARRFWVALTDAQKAQQKNEERLEQQLGKLKGDYLLAKAEWEEKLNQSNEKAETFKEKYEQLKDNVRNEDYLEQARSFVSRSHDDETHETSMYGSVKSATSGRAGSVASIGSGLKQQAKTLVDSMNNFNCNALNERTPTGGNTESRLRDLELPYEGRSSRKPSRSSSRGRSQSRSFREYSRSPQRVDV